MEIHLSNVQQWNFWLKFYQLVFFLKCSPFLCGKVVLQYLLESKAYVLMLELEKINVICLTRLFLNVTITV